MIYEYKCSKNHEFEVEQSIRDTSPKECPKCHEKTHTRIISNTTFTLKGGGWASDGYTRKFG